MADPVTAGLLIGGTTALKSYGKYKAGKSAKKEAYAEAAQLEQNANRELGHGVREAADQRREGDTVLSNAITAMAAGGGLASDAGSIDVLSRISREAQYNSLSVLYDARKKREGEFAQAAALRKAGRNAKRAGTLAAIGTAISGGAKAYGAYSAPTTAGGR